MTAHDDWASYLDPDTPPESRSELAAELDAHETAALDRIGGLLAGEAVWGEPSDDLRSRLLAEAAAEADAQTRAGTAPLETRSIDHDPAGLDGDELSRRRAPSRRRAWMAGGLVAAAAAVVVAVLAIGPLFDRSDVTTYEVAGTALTPDLMATVDVDPRTAGVAITLHVRGLPPAGENEYYAAWVMQDMAATGEDPMDAPMVGIGSFHWRGGGIPIELWSGVDTDRYPIMIVTLQNEDEPPTASDRVVMTARLTDG